ncbi:MAG: tyrosine-type recombinase/integrase, partial [Candidatus Dormibacteraceae bacterium]
AVPSQGNRVVVTGKGAKQRVVYLTQDAGLALKCYLDLRSDTSPALFINYDRSESKAGHRRLTTDGARHVVRRLRSQLGVWSFASPHVARHTAATSLLEVSGGDVRLVQEVLGHATLGTMQGYTKIVDARKQEAYRGYQTYLEEKKEEGGRAEG